ncbi:bifunctional DNA-formamidopyrimidine glycosylase/DNA-(apurinic or apyrimidinic site) lyase [Microbacterium sp. MPKO10]|uniref:bifunctional DNA-formamidopyrimidine glycosylase/DNA-(apurinic or apyrimidinic site) lyase n=1 Tax=Microbacterium sp. MPKO10 TaxID=2989818 RepID=UPI0022368C6D|nr:bifunctional DNA-formamidopyrimidine glycosylase/DNA-(apurinic or apyrimidinic site) lyase [Microbacterium sp. MPKO10]MCW4459322.1 bifunctional DNA-formamidopyrimidine glycosylase/DNA-(apurinic or apyrimidinic site) lyase [Microbacterium sp. MPKO10]
MPELPEVEVVRRGLEPAVTGALVTSVEVRDERSLRRHDRAAGEFADLLTGQRISSAVRRGKFLWFPLTEREALVTHLGMSGQVLLREPGVDDRHTRIALTIEHPDHGELQVNFADQRIFGSMAIDPLVPTADSWAGGFAGQGIAGPTVPSQVAHIARDILDPAFDADGTIEKIRRRRSGIKRVLLDQTLISGIGNIYADEALWAAGVHGEQAASRMSRARISTLLAAVRNVLEKALAEGGTSFDAQYVNVNGQSGYFAHSLNAYGQAGRPCSRCGSTIMRASFMNRSSHFCPVCQRRR